MISRYRPINPALAVQLAHRKIYCRTCARVPKEFSGDNAQVYADQGQFSEFIRINRVFVSLSIIFFKLIKIING